MVENLLQNTTQQNNKALRSAATRMQRALEAALAAGASDDAPEVARCRARNAEVGKLVTIKELLGAGAVGELKAKFTVRELMVAGVTVGELKAAGFTVGELKEAGVTVAAFKAAGYQKDELKGVGFTWGDMYEGGYAMNSGDFYDPNDHPNSCLSSSTMHAFYEPW